MTCLGSGCFEMGTEGCWDLLDGSTTCEYLEAIPQDLSVNPGCRGGKASMSAMFGKKPQYFHLCPWFFFYFLAQQKVLLFSLPPTRDFTSLCSSTALIASRMHNALRNQSRGLQGPPANPKAFPIMSEGTGGDLGAFLNVGMGGGIGGLNLSKVSSLGSSFTKLHRCRPTCNISPSHVFRFITFSYLHLAIFFL